jgi:hypothetical protein
MRFEAADDVPLAAPQHSSTFKPPWKKRHRVHRLASGSAGHSLGHTTKPFRREEEPPALLIGRGGRGFKIERRRCRGEGHDDGRRAGSFSTIDDPGEAHQRHDCQWRRTRPASPSSGDDLCVACDAATVSGSSFTISSTVCAALKMQTSWRYSGMS